MSPPVPLIHIWAVTLGPEFQVAASSSHVQMVTPPTVPMDCPLMVTSTSTISTSPANTPVIWKTLLTLYVPAGPVGKLLGSR